MDSYNLTLLYIVYHYSSHLLIMSLLLCDTLYIHLFFLWTSAEFMLQSE